MNGRKVCKTMVWSVMVWLFAANMSIAQFSQIGTGGLMQNNVTLGETNLALASSGATAFCQDSLGVDWGPAALNDGAYGDSANGVWIAGSVDTFCGVALASPANIDRIALTFVFSNRVQAVYDFQVTSVVSPDETTPDEDWKSVGAIQIDNEFYRHLFSFPVENNVTGVRIHIVNMGGDPEKAINELEVYAENDVTPYHFRNIGSGGVEGGAFISNTEGGVVGEIDLALAINGAQAFAQDVVAVGFESANAINGDYSGNGAGGTDWIGALNDTFLVVRLAQPTTINRVAFGNSLYDPSRVRGLYEVQVTTVADPDASTTDSAWTTIGRTEQGLEPVLTVRRLYEFVPQENVTGVRLHINALANQVCINEMEVYASPTSDSMTLIERVGSMSTGATEGETNIALASNGATAFAKDSVNTDWLPAGAIDGTYTAAGGSTWIAATTESFLGVAFDTPQNIDRFAMHFAFATRVAGSYLFQVTTVASPDEMTDDSEWTTVGGIDWGIGTDMGRRLYQFAPQSNVTAVRLKCNIMAGTDPAAITELEVYGQAVPVELSQFMLD